MTLTTTTALRFIEPLASGTTAPILTKCADGRMYAVKFPALGAKSQFLVNELLAGVLIREYGLPCTEPALVNLPGVVDGKAVLPPEHAMRIRDGRAAFGTIPCAATVYESGTVELGDGMKPPATVDKLHDPGVVFGAVVFDTWVFNEDARQFLARWTQSGRLDLLLFDNEGAFNRIDWRVHQPKCRVSTKSSHFNAWLEAKVRARELAPFEQHLRRLERSMDRSRLQAAAMLLPRAWLDPALLDPRRACELDGLIEALDQRRSQVRGFFEKGEL